MASRKRSGPKIFRHGRIREVPADTGDRPWTGEDVQEVIGNPIYVGLGPYPPLITEEMFFTCHEKLVKEMGVRPYLRLLLSNLKSAFPLESHESTEEG